MAAKQIYCWARTQAELVRLTAALSELQGVEVSQAEALGLAVSAALADPEALLDRGQPKKAMRS